MLGRGRPHIDPVGFGAKYRNIERDRNGIPVAHAELAQRVAEMIANVYETKYDKAKEYYRFQGENWFGFGRDASGNRVPLNFCGIAGATDVARLLDRDDLLPYTVLGLHALLVDGNHYWIFCHLCEAVFSADHDVQLQEQMGEELIDLLDDVRTAQAEAIYQYLNCLALTQPARLRVEAQGAR